MFFRIDLVPSVFLCGVDTIKRRLCNAIENNGEKNDSEAAVDPRVDGEGKRGEPWSLCIVLVFVACGKPSRQPRCDLHVDDLCVRRIEWDGFAA